MFFETGNSIPGSLRTLDHRSELILSTGSMFSRKQNVSKLKDFVLPACNGVVLLKDDSMIGFIQHDEQLFKKYILRTYSKCIDSIIEVGIL